MTQLHSDSFPLSGCLHLLAVVVLTAAMFTACADDSTAPQPDAAPLTLDEEMTTAGLPAGTYSVDDGGEPVCTDVITSPGSGLQRTVIYDLSGFETVVLIVEEEVITLRGAYDDLGARWTEADCVEYDSSVDQLTRRNDCSEDPCTPFSVVRLCANGGNPRLTAAVDSTCLNDFSASLQPEEE